MKQHHSKTKNEQLCCDNVMAMMIVEAEDEGDAMWKVKRLKHTFIFDASLVEDEHVIEGKNS
jgi:hypothetical protein